MFNGTNNYSLADLAAVTNGNNDGFGNGGSWAWFLIIILLFAGNWGYGNGGFFGGNNGGGVTDGYVLASDFSNLSRQLDNGIDSLRQQGTALANGISSLGYDQLGQFNNTVNAINGANQSITNMLNTNNVNAMQNTFALQTAINGVNVNNNNNTNAITAQLTGLGTQMAQCCCDNKNLLNTSFGDLRYNLADQSCQTRRTVTDATTAITLNQDANTRSILEAIKDMQTQNLQDKISTLQAENQALRFAESQANQNNYLVNKLMPTPMPAYPAQNLYGGTLFNTCNCNTGCGC